jgi:hypothetical protein
VEFVFAPEPEPEEREAVTLALQRLLTGERVPAAFRSAWRQAGISESVAPDYATARPRSSPGATRA